MNGRTKTLLRRASLIVLSFTTVISALLVVVIVRRTSGFAVRGVIIEGAEPGRETAVRSVASVFEGRSLFKTDTALLERKLADLPWVKSVKVGRKFPSSLRIRFRARKSIAFLNTPTDFGQKLFLVDAEGVLLDEPVGTAFPDGPVVTGLEVKNAFLGRTVEMPELKALLGLLAELKERDYGLYSSLQEIRMENSSGLVRYRMLLTEQNIPVRTDRLDDRTLADLEAVLRHYGSAGKIRSIFAADRMLFVEERI